MKTLQGKLTHGLEVGSDLAKDFEIREGTAGDMFDAEQDASPMHQTAFRGALIARQIVRLGDIEGPLPFEMMRKLHPEDFAILVDALDEVEQLGKPPLNDSGDTATASSSSP